MIFSVVVAFKNRDERRVRFFLESLSWQSEKNFELLFVNQGSDEQVNSWVEKLVSEYFFVSYFHNRTEGYLWNKSNALNIGIKAAKGKYLIIADIDVIFPSNFLNKLASHLKKGTFITYDAYYLPQSYRYDFIGDLFCSNIAPLCSPGFIGVCAAERKAFIEINGYDEFYLVWGAEDDDIIKRLQDAGKERVHVKADQVHLFHQWHQSRSPGKPSEWYLTMVNHLYSTKDNRVKIWGQLLTIVNRPVLPLLESKEYEKFVKLSLHGRPLLFFNPFIAGFHQLKQGDVAWLEYEHPEPKESKGLNFINRLYKRGSIKEESERITFRNIVNFIEYFIGTNIQFIEDYYFSIDGSKIFLCMKKL